MKEEALKLADEMDKHNESFNPWILHSSAMIRRLVEELDKAYSDGEVCGGCGAIRYDPICEKPQTKPLSDEEIKQIFQEQTGFYFDDNPADDLALMDFARAIEAKVREEK